MPHPYHQISWLTLAGAVMALSALRAGARVHAVAMQGKAQFMEAGGERFAYLPCLNADEPGMDMLESLVRRELAGWL